MPHTFWEDENAFFNAHRGPETQYTAYVHNMQIFKKRRKVLNCEPVSQRICFGVQLQLKGDPCPFPKLNV